MENSSRVYSEGLFQRGPSTDNLTTQASTGGSPTLTGSFGSVSCGVAAPLLWVLVPEKFCLCPPRKESLFPLVLWKACNKIPLALKARFPRDSQSLYQIPTLVNLTCSSEPSQDWKNFFGIIVLQFVGHLPSEKEI